MTEAQPLLIYVGRLHVEKKPDVIVEAFRKLPKKLGARLVLLGEGPLRDEIAELGDPRIIMPGYIRDRGELARWLASADIYVSAFAQETFGVSIVEAQAVGPAGGRRRRGGAARPGEQGNRPAGPGQRCRGDGAQHHRRVGRRPRGDGQGGARAGAAVQLGPDVRGFVQRRLSAGLRQPPCGLLREQSAPLLRGAAS